LNRRRAFADYGISGPHEPWIIRANRGSGMKIWPPFGALMAFSLAASLLPIAAPAHAEKRVALVIGNNDYKNVPRLQRRSTTPAPWAIRSSSSAFL
jgi:hypothetical protein